MSRSQAEPTVTTHDGPHDWHPIAGYPRSFRCATCLAFCVRDLRGVIVSFDGPMPGRGA